MKKCLICDIKKIKTIIFHEFEFQKCYKCEFIRIFQSDFENFIKLIMHKYNVGNIKKYDSDFNCNEYEYKLIKDFENVFKKIEIETNVSKNKCDFCGENLHFTSFYNNLNYFYCKECKSIYFLQKDFNIFLNFLVKDLEKRNYFLKVKVILKNKIRKHILKFKEIFLYRRKKNNVKK